MATIILNKEDVIQAKNKEIKQLREAIREWEGKFWRLEEKLRWIPVSERLPDCVRTMRVLLKAEAVKKLCENHGFYGEDENGWGWEILGAGVYNEVTHWQEKQELPWEALENEVKK